MNLDSPEGLSQPYDTAKDSFSGTGQCAKFYRASRLYDPRTGVRREWPPEATDEDVREAIFKSEAPNGQTAREVERLEHDEPTEATDEEVREAIFTLEDPDHRTARDLETHEPEGDR